MAEGRLICKVLLANACQEPPERVPLAKLEGVGWAMSVPPLLALRVPELLKTLAETVMLLPEVSALSVPWLTRPRLGSPTLPPLPRTVMPGPMVSTEPAPTGRTYCLRLGMGV